VPDGKSLIFLVLIVDMSSTNTSLTWRAENMDDLNMGNKIYFSIQNADDISCQGCVAKTQAFYVTDKRPIMSGSASPSGSASATLSSVASSRQGLASTSTTAGAAAAHTSASQSTMDNSSSTKTVASSQKTAEVAAGEQTSSPRADGHKSNSNAIGLGVGLGVGFAILIALIVLLFVCLRRRKRQERERRLSYRPTGSGNWTQSNDPLHPAEEVREVKPGYASGMTEATAVGSLMSPKFRESDSSRISSSNPPRPATPASAMSHKSWIEPFDFERPESRAPDAMSQLRQSTLVDAAESNPRSSVAPTPTTATGAAGPATTLAPPADDDAASSNYSMHEETFGPESPSDAAIVRSPSSAVGLFSRPQEAHVEYAGVGPRSSPFRSSLDRPSQANVSQPSQAYGRHWPLPR
jgi:hypothetical protein